MSLADHLRHAMSHWPSGVAVLATRGHSRIEAITLNSLISVSLDPALILVSISKRAAILSNLVRGSSFTISALSGGQARVASMIADRVPDLPKLFVDDDAPVIRDAMFTMSCEVTAVHEGGDHVLVLGQVVAVEIGNDERPLIYHRGRYQ